jgi:PAS domain S-box-containing protein
MSGDKVMNVNNREDSKNKLRLHAEKTLCSSNPGNRPLMGADKLLHELQVHQIELEMQNEELSLAKLALEKSHAHYLELYDFAPVGYLTLNNHGIIVECNLTSATMLGVQHQKLFNVRLDGLVDDEYKDQWHQQLHLARQAPDKYSCQLPFRRANGEIVYLHVDFVALREKSELPSLRITLTDLTLQKNTETALHAAETQLIEKQNELRGKMEQAFRMQVAIQTVVAIAHELNQPLTAISYCADAAEAMVKYADNNPQKLVEILEMCSQQALRAGQAIPRILSQLVKEGDNPTLETLDINKAVCSAIRVFTENGRVNAKFIEHLEVALPLVSCDGLHLEKVLINLFQNSLDAIQAVESVDNAIDVSTCICLKDPNMVQVTVGDCGIGVPDIGTLKKIFEAFYTTKPGGLGMGLTVSRALVKAIGGDIWAEVNPTKGISVCFTLPFDTGLKRVG